jgi:hypothetical protein
MSLAPDNSTICTASADETLRFWKVFESGSSPYSEEKMINKLNLKEYSLRWQIKRMIYLIKMMCLCFFITILLRLCIGNDIEMKKTTIYQFWILALSIVKNIKRKQSAINQFVILAKWIWYLRLRLSLPLRVSISHQGAILIKRWFDLFLVKVTKMHTKASFLFILNPLDIVLYHLHNLRLCK